MRTATARLLLAGMVAACLMLGTFAQGGLDFADLMDGPDDSEAAPRSRREAASADSDDEVESFGPLHIRPAQSSMSSSSSSANRRGAQARAQAEASPARSAASTTAASKKATDSSEKLHWGDGWELPELPTLLHKGDDDDDSAGLQGGGSVQPLSNVSAILAALIRKKIEHKLEKVGLLPNGNSSQPRPEPRASMLDLHMFNELKESDSPQGLDDTEAATVVDRLSVDQARLAENQITGNVLLEKAKKEAEANPKPQAVAHKAMLSDKVAYNSNLLKVTGAALQRLRGEGA